MDKQHWNGLGLSIYRFSGDNEGIAAPGIPDYIISSVISGYAKANSRLNDSSWQKQNMRTGSIMLLDKESMSAWQWKESELSTPSPTTAQLFLDRSVIEKAVSHTYGLDSRHIELPSIIDLKDKFIYQLILELKTEAENASPFGKLFGETAAQLLAIHLLRKYCTITAKVPEYKGGLPKRKLQQVMDYINDHLNQNISLESLSILTGLSSYHFARLFKQSTGLAPHQYVVQCRMERAKEWLAHTNWPVIRIAAELGYESQSHFTRLFKRYTGATPAIYRKNYL